MWPAIGWGHVLRWNINISGGFIAVHSVVYIQVLYYIRSNPTFYRHMRQIIPLLIFWLFWTSVSLGLSLVGLNWNYVSKFLAPHIVLASAHMQTDVLKISSVCLKIGLGGGDDFYIFLNTCVLLPHQPQMFISFKSLLRLIFPGLIYLRNIGNESPINVLQSSFCFDSTACFQVLCGVKNAGPRGSWRGTHWKTSGVPSKNPLTNGHKRDRRPQCGRGNLRSSDSRSTQTTQSGDDRDELIHVGSMIPSHFSNLNRPFRKWMMKWINLFLFKK